MTIVRAERLLRYSAVVFSAGLLSHNLDHVVRQTRGLAGLSPGVFWAGTTVYVLAAVAIALVLTRRPQAALAAAIVGLGSAATVAAAHLFLPQSSAFSDPYRLLPVDAVSWVAMLSEVAGALVFGLAGVLAMQVAARHGAEHS